MGLTIRLCGYCPDRSLIAARGVINTLCTITVHPLHCFSRARNQTSTFARVPFEFDWVIPPLEIDVWFPYRIHITIVSRPFSH